MHQPNRNLAQIERDLASADQGARVRASWDLLDWSRKDAGVRERALVVFQTVAEQRLDAPTVNSAVKGIEEIAGPVAGWNVRTALLDDPRDDFVRGVALAIDDRRYILPLLDLLAKRDGAALRTTVLRVLGRLKDPIAFDAIVVALADPVLRPDAIDALADLGDARAIPHLQPFLADATPTWEVDNHGPMMQVRDHAKQAIDTLSKTPPAAPAVAAASSAAPSAVAASVASPQAYARPRPLITNFGTMAASVGTAIPPSGKTRLLCYVPLVALVLEIPWCILMLMSQMGYKPNGFPREAQRIVTTICAFPVALGLLVGLYALRHGYATRNADRVWLTIGYVLCGLLVMVFLVAIVM